MFLAANFSSLANASEKKLTFFAAPNSVYSIVSEKVLKAAYQGAGFEVEIEILPHGRGLVMAGRGDLDGAALSFEILTRPHPELLPVKPSFFKSKIVVFSQPHIAPINSWEELKRYNVGILLGMKRIAGNLDPELLTVVQSKAQLVKLLVLGRVDAIVAGNLSIRKILNSDYRDFRVNTSTTSLKSYVLYHYLHAKYAHLIPKISAKLGEMPASGEVDRIIDSVVFSGVQAAAKQ